MTGIGEETLDEFLLLLNIIIPLQLPNHPIIRQLSKDILIWKVVLDGLFDFLVSLVNGLVIPLNELVV